MNKEEIRQSLKMAVGGSGPMKRVRLEPILSIGFNLDYSEDKKEECTMKVSYKGVTGELVRLERTEQPYKWELEIWSNEKGCKVSFPDVSMKDVKFLGGEVTYG